MHRHQRVRGRARVRKRQLVAQQSPSENDFKGARPLRPLALLAVAAEAVRRQPREPRTAHRLAERAARA